MFSRTFQMLRTSPVTWLILFICPLLWTLDVALSIRWGVPYEVACGILGAEAEFLLWDGDWWRVITTAFHHGGLLHLLCNLSLVGMLGRLLEFRLGCFYYLSFCIAAIAVSGVAQSLSENYVGLSGMGFAQFALIWLWRRHDKWWQDQISDQLIQFGFIWFFACFIVDRLGIMPIGNVAHAAGFVYGCLIAMTGFGGPRAKQWWPVILSSHIFLMPGFYFVTHPVWNGKYHWRCGDLARSPTEKIKHYENALRQDPDLDGPWINLALIYAKDHEFMDAWRCIIRGLARYPSSEKMLQVAREVGRNFIGPQNRAQARTFLEQIFGDNAKIWEETLLVGVPLEELPQLHLPESRPLNPEVVPDVMLEEPELPNLPTTLPRRALDEIPYPGRKLPAPDPDAPGSAEEGRAA